MVSHYEKDTQGISGVLLSLSVHFILLSFLLSLHESAPLCFACTFPPPPLTCINACMHITCMHSTDLELVLASVPSAASYGCLSVSYSILTTTVSPKPSYNLPFSLPLFTFNTFQTLHMPLSSSFLSSYTLYCISQTGPILSLLHV